LNLNSLISSSDPLAPYVTLDSATAINDQGWITATGQDSRTQVIHAYLLTPVAKPSCGQGAYYTCMESRICSGFDIRCEHLCDVPCSGATAIWRLPVNGAIDPWLSGTSVSFTGADWGQTRAEFAALDVRLATQGISPLDSSLKRRAGNVGQVISPASPIIGPVLHITAKTGRSPFSRRVRASQSGPLFRVSLAYNPAAVPSKAIPKLAKLDEAKGQWLFVSGQYLDRSKHLITSTIASDVGEYTIIALRSPAAPSSH
jgi:hypothetical protein